LTLKQQNAARLIGLWLICTVVVTVLNVLTLFSPPMTPEIAEAKGLSKDTAFVAGLGPVAVNIDSYGFVQSAADPATALAPTDWRQQRPLLSLTVWALAKPVQVIPPEFTTGPEWLRFNGWLDEYHGYLVLNAFLLGAGLAMFLRLLPIKGLTAWLTTLPFLVWLTINEVTRAFFWTAHEQMFTIAVATGGMLAFTRAWQHRLDSPGPLIGVSAVLAAGLLAYGTTVIVFVGLFLIFLVRKNWRQLAILSAVTVLPYAIWYAFVRITTGGFYVYESYKNRTFVWVFDAAKGGVGDLWAESKGKIYGFWQVSEYVLANPLALLTLVILLTFLFANLTKVDVRLISAAALYFLLAAGFFWAFGGYSTRHAWAMVPAILLSGAAVGLGGSETMRAKWRWVYPTMGVSVTALYVYVWTTTGGPYG
jgi:hypothetical protein